METFRRFRLIAVRLSLLITILCAAVLYVFFGRIVAHGLLLGGIAGTLLFWITAVRTEKLAKTSSKRLKWNTSGLMIFKYMVFSVTLWQSYNLDKETMRGFIASAAGIFIINLVLLILGLTGLDLRKEK